MRRRVAIDLGLSVVALIAGDHWASTRPWLWESVPHEAQVLKQF